MKRANLEKSILVLMAVAMLVLPVKGLFSMAQEADAPTESQEKPVEQPVANRFLDKIQAEISSNQSDLSSINSQISDVSDKIGLAQGKINTLKDQVANLDTQIDSTQKIIDNVGAQLERKQSEIDTLEYEIDQKKTEISYQRQMISEYLKVMFKDQSDLNNFDQNGATLNTLKLLLSDENTSEKLRSIRYSEVLEEQGRKIFEKLGELMEEQEANQKIMQVKRQTLAVLHEKLIDQQKEVLVKKQAKQNLLEETQGQQKIYQQLLDNSRAEQDEVVTQIDTLRKNLAYVQKRAAELGSNFNPDDYADLLNVHSNSKLLNYLTITGDNKEFAPIWPVNPARGISAYFHEASYAKAFGMTHQAVDIRAYQSTPIKAAADGVVYKAKDNGYGYSYIILAHANGYMTLYGHVSNIMVEEGDDIKVGDIIGLSGATPGSKGAGLYTTGPHLHFEVMKNGTHVDPLDYLNLAYLDLEHLQEKYVAKALGDREKVSSDSGKIRVKNDTETVSPTGELVEY